MPPVVDKKPQTSEEVEPKVPTKTPEYCEIIKRAIVYAKSRPERTSDEIYPAKETLYRAKKAL